MRARPSAVKVAGAATLLCIARVCIADGPGPEDAKTQCVNAADEGQSRRDDGQYRAARACCVTCSRDVCPNIVAQSCMRWLREIGQDAPTVVLGARDEQGADLTDVRVSLDGSPFATQLDGRPIEVAAGEHVFRFDRDAAIAVEKRLVLRAGEKARVVAVTLRSALAAAPVSEPACSDLSRRNSRLSPRVVTAASIAVGALAAAGVGAYFVIESDRERGDAAALRGSRPSDACTDADATPTCQSLDAAVGSQHQDVNLATSLFGGAAALAAGAALVWLAWPNGDEAPRRTTAWIEPSERGAALRIGGTFE
jgi:hypothetical protein